MPGRRPSDVVLVDDVHGRLLGRQRVVGHAVVAGRPVLGALVGQPAVERQTGGRLGGGAMLTPFGLRLVQAYRTIEREAAAAARKELVALRTEIKRAKG